MLRFLFTTTAVLALALPVTAQDAEVGQEYEITIATEEAKWIYRSVRPGEDRFDRRQCARRRGG